MIRGLIFDLDGVLVDTAKYHYLAWKRLCAELGYKFDINDNELLKGVSRIRSFEIILEINNVTKTPEEIEHYCGIKNGYYLEYIRRLTEDDILPGAKEFLEDAKRLGYKLALGSASKNSRLILDRLKIEDMFDAIIDGTKVQSAKPDPEVFLKGAAELGLKPEECIVFEDSAAGITAARNGHMRPVGVSNPEIRDYCDYFIRSFAETTAEVLVKKVTGE